MRTHGRNRGFGMLTAVVTLGFALILLAALTVQMAGLTDRAARFSRGVRSRALAEAGIEAGLNDLSLDRAREVKRTISLAGGACTVRTVRAEGSGVHLVSEGRLSVAGGAVITTIDVRLDAGSAGVMHIGSRSESTRFVR